MKELIYLFREYGLREGKYTLPSGKQTDYYLDVGKVMLHWEGAREVTDRLAALIFNKFPESTILAAATLNSYWIIGSLLMVTCKKAIVIRKRVKTHKTTYSYEGVPITSADKILVIEDVCGNGEASMRAIDILGSNVIGVVAVIDRLEGAKKSFAELGIPFRSLLTIEDIR